MRISDWSSDVCSSDLMVRGLSGQEATGVRLIPGSRVDLRDGRSLLLYPKDRAAWSRLTRLLSLGKARGGKGNCWLDWPDVAAWAEGLVAVLLPDAADERTRLDLGELREVFRSEEHTSELQSLMRISYAVFCLKKKTQ